MIYKISLKNFLDQFLIYLFTYKTIIFRSSKEDSIRIVEKLRNLGYEDEIDVIEDGGHRFNDVTVIFYKYKNIRRFRYYIPAGLFFEII